MTVLTATRHVIYDTTSGDFPTLSRMNITASTSVIDHVLAIRVTGMPSSDSPLARGFYFSVGGKHHRAKYSFDYRLVPDTAGETVTFNSCAWEGSNDAHSLTFSDEWKTFSSFSTRSNYSSTYSALTFYKTSTLSIPLGTYYIRNFKLESFPWVYTGSGHQLSVTDVRISAAKNILTITANGYTDSIAGYRILVSSGGILVGSTEVGGSATTVSLSTIGSGLPVSTYDVVAVPVTSGGRELRSSNVAEWLNTAPLAACAPMTLRFRFTKSGFDPSSLTSKGTWNKLSAGNENIWDWTYSNADWRQVFSDKFSDSSNLVDVIDSGDTSSISAITGIFSVNNNTNNYLRSCISIDIGGATDLQGMFYTGNSGYYNTVMEEAPYIDMSHVISTKSMFIRCTSLKKVPQYDLRTVVNGSGMFNRCDSIEYLPDFETGSMQQMDLFVSGCYALRRLPRLELGSAQNLKAVFNALPSITDVPKFDYSSATSIEQILGVGNPDLAPQHMDYLPDMGTLTDKLVTCKGAFKNIRNVKYGLLEAYEVLKSCNPTTYTDCFLNCGIDTEEGRAQLNQIPQSWGGLMAET